MNKHMYILADGGRIAASGPSEFVRLLREGSWFDSECSDGEYMVNFSNRYHELHGLRVRTDTPGNFLDDLKKYGTVTVDEDMVIVCVVGDLEWDNVGFEARIVQAMKDVPVRMISYGGSNYNVSLLIKASDKTRALQALSDHLFNNKA